MTLPFEFLASPKAMALRRELADGPSDPLRLVERLRRILPAEHARALAEQIALERRARTKFEAPQRLLFERVALEQATSPGIARHHASLVPEGASVLDLGCGLGADAIAFARAGRYVVAADRDAGRVRLAAHNLTVAAPGSATVVRADASAPPARTDFLYVDPDRRRGRGRIFRLADASPAWDRIAALVPRFRTVLVKAPPAIPDEEIPPGASVTFLSEGGECREALLHLPAAPGGRVNAVRVEDGAARSVAPGPAAPVAAHGTFLLDVDPALRRAGGVDALAREIGAARTARGSTYLFAEEVPASPWVRAYRVLHVFPFRPRDLARRLAEEPPREIVVKQRGVGLQERAIRHGLPTASDGPTRVVILWRDGPRRMACLGEPWNPR